MEFGLFVQAHVPRHETEADPVGAEHKRLMDELELSIACDRSGWKYVWAVEHHFLEEYSHISASESFLPFVAARTKNVHVGSAIYNITPPVNHPARMAERVAMLDHLSDGRFEFGTGRGSSSTEFKGFGIPDGDTTREMFDEALPQILRMWREEKYSYQGKYFSMPERNVLPKPWTKPHPPLWVACGSPATFEKAGRLGMGALCFSLGAPRDFEKLVKAYKDAIRNPEPVGEYINDNVACVSMLVCHEDRREARRMALNMGNNYHNSLVFRYLDTFPRPANIPPWPTVLPEPSLEQLEERIASGQRVVGDPEECRRGVQKYVDIGCDQIIFGVLASTQPIDFACRSVGLFGREVIPHFDRDPVHSTVRQRQAQLGGGSGRGTR